MGAVSERDVEYNALQTLAQQILHRYEVWIQAAPSEPISWHWRNASAQLQIEVDHLNEPEQIAAKHEEFAEILVTMHGDAPSFGRGNETAPRHPIPEGGRRMYLGDLYEAATAIGGRYNAWANQASRRGEAAHWLKAATELNRQSRAVRGDDPEAIPRKMKQLRELWQTMPSQAPVFRA